MEKAESNLSRGVNDNLELFVAVFSEQFQNRAELITASTQFRKLDEWSSMQSLFVIAAIDEHFEMVLQEEDFRNSITVKDLFERLTTAKSE